MGLMVAQAEAEQTIPQEQEVLGEQQFQVIPMVVQVIFMQGVIPLQEQAVDLEVAEEQVQLEVMGQIMM